MDGMDAAAAIGRRATVSEIARVAGVGTATVDRVLNERPHVSATTRQRVLQARAAIEAGIAPAARSRPWRLKVFLPAEAGPSTEFLAECFQDFGAEGRATIECALTKKMEPAVLARKLHACAGQGIDAVAFQALEDPRVHEAVEELAALNIPSLAVVSGLASSSLVGLVGIDNRAAGRTAAYLMGRFARRSGPVAVVSGGQLYRVHEDREIGFRASLRGQFRHLDVVETCNGQDDSEGNYREIARLIEDRPDLVGIYNVGGGDEGIVRALREAGATGEILFIGHNLTPATRKHLLDGSMDALLHQDMRRVARQAVEALVARLERRTFRTDVLPVEIITRENILGATFG